ncbi:MAG: leucine-rich repeat protein [Eubacteriales bacterium]
MKHTNLAVLSAVALLSVGALALFTSCGTAESERYVRVMLAENEHYTIAGENPVVVPAGEDAVFHVEMEDGYAVVDLSGGAVYSAEDGTVTVPAVQYPTTVDTDCAIPEYFWYEYRYSMQYGTIESSLPSEKYMQNTEITITAVPNDGAVFLGFSKNKPLSEGGELLSDQLSYTFRLNANVTVYPNYVDATTFLLTYDANGGTAPSSASGVLYSTNSSEFYYCPNTLLMKGQFVRDGYALLGYNTEPDGSGTYYGTGWNVDTGEGMTASLYCQWIPFSPVEDFEYEVKNGEVTIRGYLGEDEFVVIPETIEGYPVTKIGKSAMKEGTFRYLYITKNVESILNLAFKDCKNLEAVYLTDNLSTATDNLFDGCDNYRTLYINGVQDPEFAYAEGGVAGVKYERLMHCADEKKVVVISGSSSLYGLSTPQLTEELGGEYTVINFGIHANTPCTFFMEVAAHFAKEGDLIINAPEPMYEQWGSATFNSTFWGIFECAFDAISLVDIREYEQVYSTFASFNASRKIFDNGRDYDWHDANSDHNGDLNYYRGLESEDHVTYVNGIQDFNRLSLHNKKSVSAFNRCVELINQTGAVSLLSFSPINVNILSEKSRDPEYRKAYVESAEKNYDAILISDLENYIMSGKYFFNTDLHPNNPGTEIRTHQLASDILAYLAGN